MIIKLDYKYICSIKRIFNVNICYTYYSIIIISYFYTMCFIFNVIMYMFINNVICDQYYVGFSKLYTYNK